MAARELAALSLVEAAAVLARRQASSLELTRACLQRLERVNSLLNIAVAIEHESALDAAAEADRRRARGCTRGPLDGIPLAHKDMFFRLGRPITCGSRVPVDFAPTRTAMLLSRFDAAGAIDVARLHMSEFALGATGHNSALGHARNPWDRERVPGGSSSGSAAAVACGAAFGALGSDTGGSARQPAAFCGVVGLKPTAGRLSRSGMMPLSFSIDSAGLIARTVQDCALLFTTVAGFDADDPTTLDRAIPPLEADIPVSLADLRIGIDQDYFYAGIDSAIAKLLDDAISVLRSLGAHFVPLKIRSIELASPLMGVIVAAEAASLHRRWIESCPDLYGPQTLARLLPGLMYAATEYIGALTQRAKLFADFVDSVFNQADVLFAPTMLMQPPTLRESDVGDRPGYMEYLAPFGHCTRPASLFGLPAISIPAGLTRAGLPCGFQLVGRPFDEATLFAVGRGYEREVGPYATPPLHFMQHRSEQRTRATPRALAEGIAP